MYGDDDVMPTGDDVMYFSLDPWQIKRPPEIRLTLVPQKSMGGTAGIQRPLSIKLHAKYPTDYPDR